MRATAHVDTDGHVARVSFLNVPSFLYARQIRIAVPELGEVIVDIAFGGAFYAFVPATDIGLKVTPAQTAQLVAAGEAIKRAVNKAMHIEHPLEADLGFLYGTILTDEPEDPAHHSRNVCVFANAEVDRSPTGTGVSARLALHHAKGELAEGQVMAVESILGKESVFKGRIVGRTQIGPYPAVIPEVSGAAYITGRHEFVIDPRDALGQGFLVERGG